MKRLGIRWALAGSSEETQNYLRFVHRHRSRMNLSYRRLGAVAVLSVVAGLGQAALLLVIVHLATALTTPETEIESDLGLLSAVDVSSGQLLTVGFVLVGFLLVVEGLSAIAQASLAADSAAQSRHRMVTTFGAADFAAQTHYPRGEARQLITGYPSYSGQVASSLGAGISAAINFAILVGSAVTLSPATAAIVAVGIGVMLVVLRPLMMVTNRLAATKANQNRELSARTSERFELGHELKAMGIETAIDALVHRSIEAIKTTDQRITAVRKISSATYRLGAFSLVLAMLTVLEVSSATVLASLTGALLMLLRSLSYGQAAQTAWQSLGEAMPFVRQFLEEEDRLTASAEDVDLRVVPDDFHIGDLSLKNVNFCYDGAETPALRDVSLKIEQGEFVALVGSSGGGKSTLIQLLLRLRNPTSGSFEVDGHSVADTPLSWWRSSVAYVSQQPQLISGTVLEAIRSGRPWITDEQVKCSAQMANIAHEIESWPAQYETPVGQLGDQLSGGQRQRIAIARALAGGPSLLLLDEPTSALDAESEAMVSQAIDTMRGELTVVVVAHRLATIENADKVFVVDGGTVRDNGVIDVDDTDVRDPLVLG